MGYSAGVSASLRWVRGWAALGVVVGGLLFAGESHAQENAEARAEQSPEDQAFALFEASQEAYNNGDFAGAGELLQQAYALHPEPVLLYNLGRAREGQNDFEGAIEAYGAFLEAMPDTEDRGAILARLQTLRDSIAERQRLEEERHAAEERRWVAERLAEERLANQDEGVATGHLVAGWSLTTAGALGLGAGVLLGVLSGNAEDDAFAAPSHLQAQEDLDRASGLATGANVAFIAGGTLLAGGVLWLVLSGLSDDADADAEPPRLEVGLGHVGISGSF